MPRLAILPLLEENKDLAKEGEIVIDAENADVWTRTRTGILRSMTKENRERLDKIQAGHFESDIGLDKENARINLGGEKGGVHGVDFGATFRGEGYSLEYSKDEGILRIVDGTGNVLVAYDTNDSITFNRNVVIDGDLTVKGQTTTLNTEEVTIKDNIILLNSNWTGTPSLNAGFEVNRGSAPNVEILWDEAEKSWKVTSDGQNWVYLKALGNESSLRAPNDIFKFQNPSGDIQFEAENFKFVGNVDLGIGNVQASRDFTVKRDLYVEGGLGQDLNAKNNTITNLANPSKARDAVNLQTLEASFPHGTRGQVLFVKENNKNLGDPDFLVRVGTFIDSDDELREIRLDPSHSDDIMDVRNGSIWEKNGDTWQRNTNRNLYDEIGPGRILLNPKTNRRFFAFAPNNYVELDPAPSPVIELTGGAKGTGTMDKLGSVTIETTVDWKDIQNKPATATRWPSFNEVTGKPSTYPPSAHNHDDRYPRKMNGATRIWVQSSQPTGVISVGDIWIKT